MAETTFHHGVRVTETTDLGDAINDIDSSVIGIVCTADDADEDTFPLNTPVLLTRVSTALGKAGTTGTLRSALVAISNLCSPKTVVIRVPEAENYTPDASDIDPPDQDSLTIGGTDKDGRYTGMYALLSAEARVGYRPRILAAPGLDSQPVAVQLAVFAKKLRAFCYVGANGCNSVAEAIKYADNFSEREVMVIYPDWEAYDTTAGETVTLPAPAVAVGLRAYIDQTVGWHKSLSNVAVSGVTGISKDIYYSLQDTDSDTDLLNNGHVTALIKRSGFRFWGNRTCDTETYIFEVYTRTAQILADTVAEAHAKYNDAPMTPSLAKDIVDGINAKLSGLVTAGKLLGGKAWFDTAENAVTDLRQGKLTISYNYTPVPPLEDLELIQDFTDTYFSVFSSVASSDTAS